jgi:hypothetical protein
MEVVSNLGSGSILSVYHASGRVILALRRCVNDQGPHANNAAGLDRAFCRVWHRRNFLNFNICKNAAKMSFGNYSERPVGRRRIIKMNAQRENLLERLGRRMRLDHAFLGQLDVGD